MAHETTILRRVAELRPVFPLVALFVWLAVPDVTVASLGTTAVWSSPDSDDTRSIAWGDWDGDGDLDLAVGNFGGPNRVYERSGGALSLAWTSVESDDTESVAWGDWDGDGDLDLAVGNLGQPSRVYENTGGALSLAWSSAGADPTRSVAWGDWDGDDDLDLAVGNDGQPSRVYANAGGALSLAWSSPVADPARSLAWGDWDGDGDPDLAVGNDGEPNRVYRNDGGALVVVWSAGDPEATRSVAWGDWDGDGDLDLAVGNDGPSSRVYGNEGGTLTPVWSSATDHTESVAWGDADGDGDLDLAAGNRGEPNRVYENTGGTLTLAWSSAEADDTREVAWGDWDGDGDLDLMSGNAGPERVHGNAARRLALAWSSPAGQSDSVTSIAWGDWDGDGDLDLAAAGAGIWVYENDAGALSLAWSGSPLGAPAYSIAWGDSDGDGDLDLAVGNWLAPNRVFENTGGALSLAWSSPESDNTYSIAWGDWDRDGDLDLAAGNWNNSPFNLGGLNRVYGNAGGTLSLAWSSPARRWSAGVAWGDRDGDGDLDLAFANSSPPYLEWHENTGGALIPYSCPDPPFHPAGGLLALGDRDADGDLDVATGFGPYVHFYGNTSGVPLWAGFLSRPEDDARSLAWGDWDGDGDLDLAIGNRSNVHNGVNRVFENAGGALSLAWSSVETDDTFSAAWGDWDADGDLDLAFGSWGAPIRVYENTTMPRPAALPESPTYPDAVVRPGTTPSAFFHSTPERLGSPVAISYRLHDAQSDRAPKIIAEYSLAGGGEWLPATDGPGGDGTIDLAASPSGTPHVFSWDAAADGACSENVTFRIGVAWQAPDQAGGPIQRARTWATTPPFRLCTTWYRDADGDGHGIPSDTAWGFAPPPGYAGSSDDCDDADPNNWISCAACIDIDGDTAFSLCDAYTTILGPDCDETNPAVYPGADEVNDGVDNECPGDVGSGLVDEVDGVLGFHTPSSKTALSWPTQQGAALYEIARSMRADFSSECLAPNPATPATTWTDPAHPPGGRAFHYLVRAAEPLAGSWGAGSHGVERINVCP